MLPKLKIILIIFATILVLYVIYFAGTNLVRASHCTAEDPRPPIRPVKIVFPTWCFSYSGEKTIRVEAFDLTVDHIDIYYYAAGVVFPPSDCHIIKTGLRGKDMGTKIVFTHQWDSTEISDYEESWIFVLAFDSLDKPSPGDQLPISVNNGLPGTPCEAPDSSGGNGNGASPPPTSGNGDSPQTGGESSQQTTSQTATTETAEDKEEKKDGDGDVEELVIEEIPITIDAFDPDIFLRGGEVSLNDVKNTTKEGTTVLNFQGTAEPNKLVTLYIFTEATVAVVKSDEQGNWAYSLDKPISTGKHTVFATVNDENVTRRSNVAQFFIAKSTQEGKSLLLVKSGFQRFYPYAAALGVAVFLAISILALYQIYNKRRIAKA